jgi:DNA repair exonuclease SbcCD nuclease subunit
MSIRLMHLADLHLGAPFTYLGAKAGERATDLESAFSRALAAASEKNIHAILISGDLFDRFDPPSDLVERARNAFEKISLQNLPIILIPGTHDSQRYSQCIYLRERFPGVDVLSEPGKPIQKLLNNEHVHFYGYSGKKPAASGFSFCRSEAEGLHIALVHGAVTENEQWTASPRDFSIGRKDIENSGFHYIALGHYHNFKEIRCGKICAVYPGTLEGLKFGENGSRHLVIAEVGESGVVIERIDFNQRNLREIQIDLAVAGIESSDSLAAAIGKFSDRNALARVVLTGSSDFLPVPKEIENRLAEEFFHLEIVDETSIYSSSLIKSIQNDRTVQGIFVRKMLERISTAAPDEKPAMELALRLTVEQFTQVHNEA